MTGQVREMISALSLLFIDEFQYVLGNLHDLSTNLIRDYIFTVNANSKKHKDVIKALCELMYIRAKLDTGLTEEYRKYWKAQGIDYR